MEFRFGEDRMELQRTKSDNGLATKGEVKLVVVGSYHSYM
jgi:hypothetical protein